MAHQKSFRAVLLILLLVYAAVFAVSSFAEQLPDQVSYYIFISSGNEADFAAYLPDVFNAFSFLHPDYVEVKLNIYQAPEFNRRTDNCIELFSGTVGGQDGFARIKSALANLGSTEQSGMVMAAEQILQEVGRQNAKVVFAGSFNMNGVSYLKSKWVPLTNGQPYAVLNSNEAQRAAVPGTILIRNDVPGMAKDLYDQLCKNDYDQMIITEATTANEFSALIDSNVRKIRILASSNTYYGSNEPVYTDGMITLIDIPAEAGQYKLELEDNGQEKKIVINTVYQPFHLGASSLEGQKEAYTMSDQIMVTTVIEAREGQIIDSFVPEDWNVKLIMTQEDKDPIAFDMNWDGTAFTYPLALRDKSGTYNLSVEADNRTRFWLRLPGEIGQISVKNDPPVMVEGTENSKDIVIWADDPLQNENETTVTLRERFADDGPAEDIGFRLEESVSWAEIQSGMLLLHPEQMSEEASGTLKVAAFDAGGLVSAEAFTINATYYSVEKKIENVAVKMTLTGEENGEFHRDTPVKMNVILSFPETLKPYLELLAGKETLNTFLEMIKAEITVNGETIPVEATKTEDGSMPELQYELIYDKVRPSGEYTVAFRAVLPEMGDKTVAETEKSLSVIDQVPTLNLDLIAASSEKEIPGPLFLNRDIQVADSETTVDIGNLVNNEINDIITVAVSSDREGMELYLTETGYYFTDEPEENWEKVDQIIWDTNEVAPALVMRSAKHGKWNVGIDIKDDKENQATGSPLLLEIKNRFHDEELLIIIALSIIGIILLLIIIAIVHQILKPVYTENDILQVSMNSYSSEIVLQSWKKKGMTLRELLIYSAVPVIGMLPEKALDKVELRAGGKKRRLVIRNAKSAGLQINLDDSLQSSNKICLESSNNKAEIILNEQESVFLKMLDE